MLGSLDRVPNITAEPCASRLVFGRLPPLGQLAWCWGDSQPGRPRRVPSELAEDPEPGEEGEIVKSTPYSPKYKRWLSIRPSGVAVRVSASIPLVNSLPSTNHVAAPRRDPNIPRCVLGLYSSPLGPLLTHHVLIIGTSGYHSHDEFPSPPPTAGPDYR